DRRLPGGARRKSRLSWKEARQIVLRPRVSLMNVSAGDASPLSGGAGKTTPPVPLCHEAGRGGVHTPSGRGENGSERTVEPRHRYRVFQTDDSFLIDGGPGRAPVRVTHGGTCWVVE